jgi:4-hydroxy-2-oxoheptanedioate aldolase
MNFAATAGDYYAQANDNILVVLQTESPRGVENAEAIYSLPGVDAIFIGPNDLRFQMRKPDGEFPTAEQHEAMIQRVITTGKKVKCPTGIHAMDPQNALERARQGMQFIAVGSDLRMMTQEAQRTLEVLRPQGEKKDVARY